jgi:hypothetical protein
MLLLLIFRKLLEPNGRSALQFTLPCVCEIYLSVPVHQTLIKTVWQISQSQFITH